MKKIQSTKKIDNLNNNNKEKPKTLIEDSNEINNSKSPEFPESIADCIITTIISYVVTQTEAKKLYSRFDEKCFEYIMRLINPLLLTEYIYYDIGIDNINILRKKFPYKPPERKKVNSWITLYEPNSSPIDRYSPTKTKVVRFKTDANNNNINNNKANNENNDLNINNNNNIIQLKEEKGSTTIMEANSILNESIEYKKKKIIKLSPIKKHSVIDKTLNQKKRIKEIIEISGNKFEERMKKQKEEKKLLELPCVDLPREKYVNKYVLRNSDEQSNMLRKEREGFITKQLEKQSIKEMMEKKEKFNYYHNRLVNMFDGSKKTFDPDGNIIDIRHPQNLISDFSIVKIANIGSKNLNKDVLKKKEETEREKQTMKEKKSEGKTYDSSYHDNSKEIFDYIRYVLLPKWQNKPFYKRFIEDESPEEIEERRKKNENRKYNTFRDFFGAFLQKYIFKGKIEHNPVDSATYLAYNKYDYIKKNIIKPSGPNFKKIKPETGVVIENKNNTRRKEIKDGGFDYIKKYSKPSLYEFSKLLMDTSNINNKIQSELIEKRMYEMNEIKKSKEKNQRNKEDVNFNGSLLEINDNSNPLIQNAFSMKMKDKKNPLLVSNQSIIDNSNNNSSEIKFSKNNHSMNSYFLKKKYNSINYLKNKPNDNIQLAKKIQSTNLYKYFNDLQNGSIIKKEEKEKETITSSENSDSFSVIEKKQKIEREKNGKNYSALPTLKKTTKKIIDKKLLQDLQKRMSGRKIINKFNFKIIKNKNWGKEAGWKNDFFNSDNTNRNYDNIPNNKSFDNNNKFKWKKYGQNIIKQFDDKYTHRSRKGLLKSSSAENIYFNKYY